MKKVHPGELISKRQLSLNKYAASLPKGNEQIASFYFMFFLIHYSIFLLLLYSAGKTLEIDLHY